MHAIYSYEYIKTEDEKRRDELCNICTSTSRGWRLHNSAHPPGRRHFPTNRSFLLNANPTLHAPSRRAELSRTLTPSARQRIQSSPSRSLSDCYFCPCIKGFLSSTGMATSALSPLPSVSASREEYALPCAREAVAAAARLEGIGWAFAPPAGRGSGVAILFYPGALVDAASYGVLATLLAGLGHAVVLMDDSEEESVMPMDRTGARACGAAAAARKTLGLPLEKILLAGHSVGLTQADPG